MDKNILEDYTARKKRVHDAIKLQVPDRVPLVYVTQSFPLYYSGLSIKDSMYDYKKQEAAYDKYYEDFKPDLGWDPIIMYPAKAMEMLDLKWFRWPGRGIEDPFQMYQFIEGEYMKEDEYDELIHDPSHYIQSKWIPRCFGALKAFEKLALRNSLWVGFIGAFNIFADHEFRQALKVLLEASDIFSDWLNFLEYYGNKMKHTFGIPLANGAFGFAPYDMIGDTMRGTVPMMMDIYDRPEKIIEACNTMLPIAIDAAITKCRELSSPYVWIWLHKGTDEFMSREQFKKFYWPSLQQYIIALTEADLIPMVYVEGHYNMRLDIIKDVPKGKVYYTFEYTDVFEAKKILGDVACIGGNVPNVMLQYGEPKEVEEYCKKLIDICGEGGGFIMDTGALVDAAKPDCLKAMFETTFTYGQY